MFIYFLYFLYVEKFHIETVFMIFIMLQDTLYVAGGLAVSENHTLWFLVFVKSTVAVLLFMSLT